MANEFKSTDQNIILKNGKLTSLRVIRIKEAEGNPNKIIVYLAPRDPKEVAKMKTEDYTLFLKGDTDNPLPITEIMEKDSEGLVFIAEKSQG